MSSTLIEASDEKQSLEISEALQPWINNPYIKAATSDNTRIAYQSDIRHFESWGGKLPATPQIIVEYLQAYAAQLNARTLSRRLTALKNWHQYQGFVDPVQHPAVQKTLSGIIRVHGKPKDKAYPLSPEDLLCIIEFLQKEDSLTAYRDNALLQMGFCGAFRRSELVQIKVEHIEWKDQGIDILIPQSKTDQTHGGQYCALPYGKGLFCPIAALNQWLKMANIERGPLFREIKKGGKLKASPLTPLSVNHILKKRAHDAGIPHADKFSSHSLRRGMATSASRLGVQIPAIMRQGRWKQVNTVIEYIEAAERFQENAALKIINNYNNE